MAAAIALDGIPSETADCSSVGGNAPAMVNFSLVNGAGPRLRFVSIGISGGIKVPVGGSVPTDSSFVDVAGITVPRGRINRHVHFLAAQWAVVGKDDAAIASEAMREIRSFPGAGGVGLRVMALGSTFQNRSGYMDDEAVSEYRSSRWRGSATPGDIDGLYPECEDIHKLFRRAIADSVVRFGSRRSVGSRQLGVRNSGWHLAIRARQKLK